MKSKRKKRILALALCMVMVVGGKLSVLADDTNTPSTEPTGIVEETQENATPEPVVTSEPAPQADTPDVMEEQPEAAPSEKIDTPKEEEPAIASETAETPAAEEPTASVIENASAEPAPQEEPAPEVKTETESPVLTMKFENEDVVITVSAEKEGIIPENAELKVVPILSDDKETEEQYKEVEEKLNKKAEDEAYDIAGFLAYDISFVDGNGNKVEPNGEVKVTMDYKKAAVPEGLDADTAKDANVTVMHLEEDHAGKVKEVVDMGELNKVETMDTTEEQKIKKVEFNTDSFSIYVVTWNNGVESRIISGGTTVAVGGTLQLTSNLSSSNHTWSSSNNAIASVQPNGQNATVTGLEPGIVTITHTYGSWWNSSSDKITITVVEVTETPIEFLKVDAETKAGLTGATFELTDVKNNSNRYTVTSNEDGLCSVRVTDGTYMMKESVAPVGYESLNTTWTVTVGNKTATIKAGSSELSDITKDGKKYYYITNTRNPGTVVNPDKTLTHEKYIKKNVDGTYDLTLNVSGSVGTITQKALLDVIFVMDTSSSMYYGMNNTTNVGINSPTSRFYNQKKAVQDAVTAIAGKDTIDARYAIVSFNQKGTTNSSWTLNPNLLNYPNSVDMWTNYEAGLAQANALLDTARAGATKVVVFLSDGDVTSYGTGNNVHNEPSNQNKYYPEAMQQAQNRLKQMSMNYFYTVGVGPKDSYEHLSELINAVPTGVTTGSYNGESANDLKNAFNNILGSITYIGCTNVTVTDTLSKYVDMVPDSNLHITVKKADGTIVVEGDGSVTVDGSTITASYNKGNPKQFSLNFPPSYQLHEGYTYYVTTKVKPTDEAYMEHEITESQTGYPHTGDKNTDENPANPKPGSDTVNTGTSSQKPGFHSNDSATVTYTYNGTTTTEDYQHPVVQVDPEKVSHSVVKEWKDVPEASQEAITVTLVAKVTAGKENATPANPVEITKTDAKLLPENMSLTLNTTNNWSGIWENLPKYYYFTQNNKAAKTEIIYTVVETANPKYEVTYEEIKTGAIVTGTKVINTPAWQALDLVKTTTNDIQIDGAEFKLSKYDETTNTWTEQATGINVNNAAQEEALKQLISGRYKLEETKAPESCSLLDTPIYFEVIVGGIRLTDENGTELTTTSDMWNLVTDTEKKTITLTVKNKVLYDLPSSGGIGIYWYMIGGMLLMIAAALILYINKRKEVLRS